MSALLALVILLPGCHSPCCIRSWFGSELRFGTSEGSIRVREDRGEGLKLLWHSEYRVV